MALSAEPAFRSLALQHIPRADHVDVVVVPLPEGATRDPARWAEACLAVSDAPGWVRALFGLRQSLVGLVGVDRASPDVFAVRAVLGHEALPHAQERHLDFAAGVGVDAGTSLVRLTATVRLKGWRGRLYFTPVRLLHRPLSTAMLRRAARRLARG